MPPLRLPGMPPPWCFFWLPTIVSMEWLRTRMALCGREGQGTAGHHHLGACCSPKPPQPQALPQQKHTGVQPAFCFTPQRQHCPQRCHGPAAAAPAAAGAARAPRWGSSRSHGLPGLSAAAGPGQAPEPWLLPHACTTFQNSPRNGSCSPAVQLIRVHTPAPHPGFGAEGSARSPQPSLLPALLAGPSTSP